MRIFSLGATSDNRRGFSIIYIPLILLLLVAFVAMAVDTGRIRLAKAQLQGAADAAARAGARSLGFKQGVAFAAARAEYVANLNVVAETTVSFNRNTDAEFGLWDASARTFTAILDDPATPRNDERNRSNACRAFARALEARGTAVPLWITPHVTTFDRNGGAASLSVRSNLQTEGVATIGGGPSDFGFIGIDSLKITGNTTSITGNLASNGNVDIGNGDVVGDARPGIGKTLLVGSNGRVTGWQANLDYTLSYPPVTLSQIPSGAIDVATLRVKDKGKWIYPLVGSNNANNPTHYKGTILSGTTEIRVTGYVDFYTAATLDLMGCSITNTQTPITAAKFKVYVIGAQTVSVGGGATFAGILYAPESNIKVNGTPDFRGSITAKNLEFLGTTIAAADTGSPSNIAWSIRLVR